MTESPDLEEELEQLVAEGRLEEALDVFEAELIGMVVPGRDDESY